MLTALWSALVSEQLKLRRSLAGWLLLGGGLFTPVIMLAARFYHSEALPAQYRSPDFWEKYWTQSWQSITLLILPVMIVMFTALVVQLEYRNNTWKQVHTSPLPLGMIFSAKLVMVLSQLVQLFVIVNVGLYLAAIIPPLALPGVPAPGPLPARLFLDRNLHYFVDCLPIVALQYYLSLQFKNFLLPLGIGMAIWFAALGFLSSSFNYVIPYGLPGLEYSIDAGRVPRASIPADVGTIAIGCFVGFIVVGYVAYVTRKERD